MDAKIALCLALSCSLFALHPAAPSGKNDKEEVVYDQRQNGSENYRLHIDGVVVAVAPAESLLNLAALADFLPEFGSNGDYGEEELDVVPAKPELTTPDPDTTEASADAAEESEYAPVLRPSKPYNSTESQSGIKGSSNTNKKNRKAILSRWLIPLLRRL